jgi:hypothetical protein
MTAPTTRAELVEFTARWRSGMSETQWSIATDKTKDWWITLARNYHAALDTFAPEKSNGS